MDTRKMEEMVDGYIEGLALELVRLSQDIRTSGEEAQEEVQSLGLPDSLFFDLWDPQGILQASKMTWSLQTDQMLNILASLDPDKEKKMRRMLQRRLHSIVDSLLSP